ncbi:MAG: YwmB family TATA-box binding protein [Clostridia bacterium]|nr:YwmB family TATA-box binding protein [Clostridia bacterium]
MQKIAKSILIFIVVSILLSLSLIFNRQPILSDYKKMEVYLSDGSFSRPVELQKSDFIFTKIYGESYELDSENFNKDELFRFLKAKEVFIEEVEDGISVYGFSKKIRYSKNINGNKINVQLFIKDDFVKVGFPLIYGSF